MPAADRRFVHWNTRHPAHQEIGRALCDFVGTSGEVTEEGLRCLVAKYSSGWFLIIERTESVEIVSDKNEFSKKMANDFAAHIAERWRGVVR